jgi:hypothetical protein
VCPDSLSAGFPRSGAPLTSTSSSFEIHLNVGILLYLELVPVLVVCPRHHTDWLGTSPIATGSILADAPNPSEQVQSFAEIWCEAFDSFRWQWRGIYNHDTTKLEKCLGKAFAYGSRQEPELDSEAEYNWPDWNRQKRQPRLPIDV